MLEGNFTEAIVKCFTAHKASAFDYNLLEPLQKLLRLSSPVAASLARTDLFSGILQKLNHKKAVVRLNLLRIVRSICDPGDEEADSIRAHPLFYEVQRLAESDNAVLVRNMASELVKANLDTSPDSNSSGRSVTRPVRRTFTPPSLQHSMTAPITPTHANRVPQTSSFMDGSVTPRRLQASSNGSDIVYRPRSRDGAQLQMTRRTSVDATGSMAKSRLPRTSMLRGSRSSLAAVSTSDEPKSRRENGLKLREQSRSVAASPASSGTAPQLSSRRKPRQPSGEIKWS